MRPTKTSTIVAATVLLASLTALTGCGTEAADPASTSADAVTIEDAWARASDSGMSSAFGVLSNDGERDITVVAARSSASDMTQLHETTQNTAGEMVMQPVEEGLVVPAGGELLFEPGENHIMMMQLVDPLEAGEEVTITLTFDDESMLEFTAPAKDFGGGDESYDGSGTGDGEQ